METNDNRVKIENNKITNIESNEALKINKSNFIKKNLFTLLLVILTVLVILINQYDIRNTSTINVVVDPNLTSGEQQTKDSQQQITIFVYEPTTKLIEEKKVNIAKQINVIEGDYINEIIKSSSFTNESMKFQSAYTLEEEGKKILKVILSSEFSNIKSNPELYEGFVESIRETIEIRDSSIKDVKVYIDGEIN